MYGMGVKDLKLVYSRVFGMLCGCSRVNSGGIETVYCYKPNQPVNYVVHDRSHHYHYPW
mgnify:CR=1 FL=1